MPNKAPNFKIPSTNSKLLELKKIKSKYKVLYFYPKDNTPGCTVETKDFNSLLSQFKKLSRKTHSEFFASPQLGLTEIFLASKNSL